MPKVVSVVSIGAGNVAHHLIPGLRDIGCEIVQVYSQNIRNAKKLASLTGSDAINDLKNISLEAELYLMMIKDDAIQEAVKQLPKLNSKQYLAHTSGQTKTHFLKTRAVNFGSFYPLQTFNKKDKTDLETTPFLIFGNNAKSTRLFRMLARQLSAVVKEADDSQRSKYHMAAVFKNNFINHLACLADSYLIENKLDPKVLDPISKSTFEKILGHKSCKLQTGPARRKDKEVMQRHLEILKKNHSLTQIYQILSQSITELYNEDS